MIYIRVQVVWLFVALALVSQLCWSHSAAQMKKKTPERRQQLLLPRVTCSARRVKAVFGSMVDENIHVRGKVTADGDGFSCLVLPVFCFPLPSVDKSGAAVPVSQSEDHCGVRVVREKNRNLSFLSRPDSCYAQIEVRQINTCHHQTDQHFKKKKKKYITYTVFQGHFTTNVPAPSLHLF